MFFMHNEDDDLSAGRLFLLSLESNKEGHSRYGNDYPSHTWQKTDTIAHAR